MNTVHSPYLNLKLVASALLACVTLNTLAQGVLFTDDFEGDTADRWNVFDGSSSGLSDYQAIFNYDYGEIGIPPAPNSADGTTRGVRLEVNNNDDIAETAAVNIFPKDFVASGNYALRFDMWMNYGGGAYGSGAAGTTEFAMQGLNHSGDKVIWNLSPDSDGFYFAVTGEGGAARDYRFYLGLHFNSPVEETFFDGGFLDRDGNGVAENETWSNNPPNYPLNYIFPSPPFETLAAPGKRWVQGELRQYNGTVTWSLNGFVIAEHPTLDAVLIKNGVFDFTSYQSGTPMLGYMDVFSSIAAPASENFVLYDNVRVIDLDEVPPLASISVEATGPIAAEPDVPGEFTLRRTGDVSSELEVYFSFYGTATPGVDYETDGLTVVGDNLYAVTIPAGSESVPVPIQPIDDEIGEPDETIVMILAGRPGEYEVSGTMIATVILEDDGDMTSINLSVVKGSMYERDVEDYTIFEVVRLGNINDPLTVELNYGGTALPGDYSGGVTTVFIGALESSTQVTLYPIDNDIVDGERTVEVSVVSSTEYVAGSQPNVVLTIRDDDREAAPVLFADTFESDTSEQYTVLFNAGNGVDDYLAAFNYNYGLDFVPPAPNSPDGSTHGLKVTVNKNDDLPSAAAVNVFLKDPTFSGNYAVRFDMYLTYDTSLPGTTEHAIFGINHSGESALRHGLVGDDGLWFAIETDGSASGGRSYASYYSTDNTVAPQFIARPAGQLAPYFANPPFLARGAPSGRWVDVEIVQFGGRHTLLINSVEIFSRTDTTGSQSGKFMLGHMDAFNSIGALGNFTVFDNIRVVDLGESPFAGSATLGLPMIEGDTLRIPFTAEGGSATSFVLEHTSSTATPFTPVADAVIEADGVGMFHAIAPVPTGDTVLFRIVTLP